MPLIAIKRKNYHFPHDYFENYLDIDDISLIIVAKKEIINVTISSGHRWVVILKTVHNEEFFVEHTTQIEQLNFVEWIKKLKGGVVKLDPICPPINPTDAVAVNEKIDSPAVVQPRVTAKKVKKVA